MRGCRKCRSVVGWVVGEPSVPTGMCSPRCAPQRNSTVAGRLAAEAQALWHMQNSTVQSQEALVVSLCWAGGSGTTGTSLKGTSRFLNLSHLSVPQAKLGESVQFLSHLAPHLKVFTCLFQPQKTCGVPSTKKKKTTCCRVKGEPGKMPARRIGLL